MEITMRSPVTGRTNTRDINCTLEQLMLWKNGEYIQKVMPHVVPEDREFLISGATPEDWNELFGEDDSI